ncbi:hypothetical protein [Simkania sp.]|uniref:hypothetical protein n=1 Tax=Simkania sp. TaxID=34094 RepID=UPI003B52E5EC
MLGETYPGISITDTSLSATGLGNIVLSGSGGNTGAGNEGVLIQGTTVISVAQGDLSIDGTGGNASNGISVMGGTISTTVSGSLTLTGTGGGGAATDGISLTGPATVINGLGTGAISLIGVGGGTGTGADGISILSGAQIIPTGTGTLTLHGTASPTATDSRGVLVSGSPSLISNVGSVSITSPDLVYFDQNTSLMTTGASSDISFDCHGLTLQDDAFISAGRDFSIDYNTENLTLNAFTLNGTTYISSGNDMTFSGSVDMILNSTGRNSLGYMSAGNAIDIAIDRDLIVTVTSTSSNRLGRGAEILGNSISIDNRDSVVQIFRSEDDHYARIISNTSLNVLGRDLILYSEAGQSFLRAPDMKIRLSENGVVFANQLFSSLMATAAIYSSSHLDLDVAGDLFGRARCSRGFATARFDLNTATFDIGGNLDLRTLSARDRAVVDFDANTLTANIGGDFNALGGWRQGSRRCFNFVEMFVQNFNLNCHNIYIQGGFPTAAPPPTRGGGGFMGALIDFNEGNISCNDITVYTGLLGEDDKTDSFYAEFESRNIMNLDAKGDLKVISAGGRITVDHIAKFGSRGDLVGNIDGNVILDARDVEILDISTSWDVLTEMYANDNMDIVIGKDLSLLGPLDGSGISPEGDNVDLFAGNLTVRATDVTLVGGQNDEGYESNVRIRSTDDSIQLSCANLQMSAGRNADPNQSDALIQAEKNVTINASGNVSVLGASSPNQETCIESVSDGNVTINTRGNLTLRGGSADSANTCVQVKGGIGGDIKINATGGVFVTGGSVSNVDTLIETETAGNITINTGFLNVTGGSGIGNTGIQTPLGDILVNCQGSCYSNAASPDNPAFLQTFGGDLIVTAKDSINVFGFSTISTPAPVGNLLMIAGRDIHIGEPAQVIALGTTNSSLTLVVDDRFPAFPEIGPGRFILEPGATLTTGSADVPLKIYTARRSQNSIGTTLNGATFIPGPYNVNTATEQWVIYYSAGTYEGAPFKIYYKEPIPFMFYRNIAANLVQLADLLPFSFPRYHFMVCTEVREKWLEEYPCPVNNHDNDHEDREKRCWCAPDFSPEGSFIFEDDVWWIGESF